MGLVLTNHEVFAAKVKQLEYFLVEGVFLFYQVQKINVIIDWYLFWSTIKSSNQIEIYV